MIKVKDLPLEHYPSRTRIRSCRKTGEFKCILLNLTGMVDLISYKECMAGNLSDYEYLDDLLVQG